MPRGVLPYEPKRTDAVVEGGKGRRQRNKVPINRSRGEKRVVQVSKAIASLLHRLCIGRVDNGAPQGRRWIVESEDPENRPSSQSANFRIG